MGPEDLNLIIDKSDPASRKFANEAKLTISKHVPGLKTIISSNNVEGSDDDEFHTAKIPTVCISEDTADEINSENSFIHSTGDNLQNIDFNDFFPKAVQATLEAVAAQARPIYKK